MAESYDQVALTLNTVCRESALKARLMEKPALAIGPDDYDLVKTYIDHGVMKIASRAAIIRGEYGGNSPEDNVDPPETVDPLVPTELLRALELWTLYEWYTQVDMNLGALYYGLYERELADHRFHPGTRSITQRPYSPL